jgi:apolipoprotein D and lipocalin family protein
MRRLPTYLIALTAMILVLSAAAPSARAEKKPRHRPRVAENVDLDRYMGVWFEIARIPTKFQKSCDCCATATYSRREDGTVDIVNECVEQDGSLKTAKAEARVTKSSNARWRATFFKVLGIGVGKGDYWILGLDDDYAWAVVGDPKRKYGWILARETALTTVQRETIDALLVDRGYDPGDFVPTPQQEGTP